MVDLTCRDCSQLRPRLAVYDRLCFQSRRRRLQQQRRRPMVHQCWCDSQQDLVRCVQMQKVGPIYHSPVSHRRATLHLLLRQYRRSQPAIQRYSKGQFTAWSGRCSEDSFSMQNVFRSDFLTTSSGHVVTSTTTRTSHWMTLCPMPSLRKTSSMERLLSTTPPLGSGQTTIPQGWLKPRRTIPLRKGSQGRFYGCVVP